MKYTVDPDWDLSSMVWRLTARPLAAYHREIPTTPGRTVLLLLAPNADWVRGLYADAGVTLSTAVATTANGLCTHFVGDVKRAEVEIHAQYDGIVSVFSHDTGFCRGQQAIRRTAYHEAMHMAHFIAKRSLGAPYKDPPFTRELEEATADWTGRLAQEFADSLHMMPGG